MAFNCVCPATEASLPRHCDNQVRDRMYHLMKYKRCFVARDAVDWLVAEGYAADRQAAVHIGRQMLVTRAFRHVVNPDQEFGDANLFFRWIEDDESAFINDLAAMDLSDVDSLNEDDGDEICPPAIRNAALGLIRVTRQLTVDRASLVRQLSEATGKAAAANRRAVAWQALAIAAVAVALLGLLDVGGVVAAAFVAYAAYAYSGMERYGASAQRKQAAELQAAGADRMTEVKEAIAAAMSAVPTASCKEEEPGQTAGGPCDPRAERMRQALCTEFPETGCPYTTDYLVAVLSAPSKKDPKRPRSFTYALEKLLKARRWRESLQIPPLSVSTRGVDCGSL